MATGNEALRWVEKLYERLVTRRPEIDKQFKYFQGEQPLAYATDAWKKFHQNRYAGFSDNWCGVVGRSPVDRLRIDGFRLSGDDSVSAEERELWDDWNRNDMEMQSAQGFLSSTIAKRSAVLVWGDANDEPATTWEHPSQVVVDYAPDNRTRRAALKSWQDGDVEYATLYLSDGVYKFDRPTAMSERSRQQLQDRGFLLPATLAGGSGGWRAREVRGEVWPLPNPLGEVPIVEWQNRPILGGNPISDIDGVIAMQDAINILWAYLFTAADHASMAARVVLGAEPPKVPILDESGQVIGAKPAKLEDLANGRLLFLPGVKDANARIDQWDAAKLDVFGTEITRAIGHVAAQTQTPGHYMLTNEKFANLNGDALTAAEVPLATKVGNQQLFYNPAAKDTARLMALVRGHKDIADQIAKTNGRRFVQWKDGATHSLSQVSDAAMKDRATGLSLRTVLETRYGMTEEQIDREFDRIRAEQADPFTLLDPVTQAAIKGAAGGNADTAAGA